MAETRHPLFHASVTVLEVEELVPFHSIVLIHMAKTPWKGDRPVCVSRHLDNHLLISSTVELNIVFVDDLAHG